MQPHATTNMNVREQDQGQVLPSQEEQEKSSRARLVRKQTNRHSFAKLAHTLGHCMNSYVEMGRPS